MGILHRAQALDISRHLDTTEVPASCMPLLAPEVFFSYVVPCKLLDYLPQVAAWLVWKAPVERNSELVLPLTLFGAQLLLGNAWNGMSSACSH